MNKQKYLIIRASTLGQLEYNVNQAMSEGYMPHGSMVAANEYFAQPMTLVDYYSIQPHPPIPIVPYHTPPVMCNTGTPLPSLGSTTSAKTDENTTSKTPN
jgi:hypothetical protein